MALTPNAIAAKGNCVRNDTGGMMNFWKAYSLLLIAMESVSLLVCYYGDLLPSTMLNYLYIDSIRGFIMLSVAFTDSAVALIIYVVYSAIYNIYALFSFETINVTYVGLQAVTKILSMKTFLILIFSFQIVLIVNEIFRIIRRGWVLRTQFTWSTIFNSLWTVMLPAAYIIEMVGWQVTFVAHRFVVFDFLVYFFVSYIMLGAFLKFRVCFLLGAVAFILLPINIIVIIISNGIDVPSWTFLCFRISTQISTAYLLLRRWSQVRGGSIPTR